MGTLEAEGDEEMRQEGWIQGAVKEEEEDEAAPSGFFELLMMS